jgi:hypothetical protein
MTDLKELREILNQSPTHSILGVSEESISGWAFTKQSIIDLLDRIEDLQGKLEISIRALKALSDLPEVRTVLRELGEWEQLK